MCSGIRKQYIWILVGMIAAVIGLFLYLYYAHPDTLISLISGIFFPYKNNWINKTIAKIVCNNPEIRNCKGLLV